MSALPAPVLEHAATASAPPVHPVWRWYEPTEYGPLWGISNAARARRLEWVKALPEEQRWREDDESPWLVRGDALHDGERVQEKLSRCKPLLDIPDAARQGLSAAQLGAEIAIRRFILILQRISAEQMHLGGPFSPRVIEAAIPRVSDDIAEFNLPTSRQQLKQAHERIQRGERVFQKVGKCGRKLLPDDPRLIAVVNSVYLDERRSVAAAHAAQHALAGELGIAPLTPWQTRSHCDPTGRRPGKLTAREIKTARVGDKALDADLPCILRDYSLFEPLGVVCFDGMPLTFKVERVNAAGEVGLVTLTLILFVDFATRNIVAWHFAANERWEETLVAAKAMCRDFGVPDVLYYDSGSAFLKALGSAWKDRAAMFTRMLGIEVVNSIPGHPQSRGIVERLNRTIQDDFCKQFLASMDSRTPTQAEVEGAFADWVELYRERSHSGDGMNGQSPRQKWDAWLRDNPAATIRRVDDATLDYVSGVVVGPRKIGRNGIRYENRLFGHFDAAVDRLRAAGCDDVYLRLDASDPSFVVLVEADGMPIVDEQTKQPIVANDRMLRGASHDEVREAISFQKRAKRATREALAAREFLLSTQSQQVRQVQAKRAAAQREADRAKLGQPPSPAVRIAGAAVAPAAKALAEHRSQQARAYPARFRGKPANTNAADALVETHRAAIERVERAQDEAKNGRECPAAVDAGRDDFLDRLYREGQEQQAREELTAASESPWDGFELADGAA